MTVPETRNTLYPNYRVFYLLTLHPLTDFTTITAIYIPQVPLNTVEPPWLNDIDVRSLVSTYVVGHWHPNCSATVQFKLDI